MKKLIFAILLIGLAGCGRDSARFDEPFIVSEISYDDDYESCVYKGLWQELSDSPFGKNSPKIYAPCGLYQIGDTIKLDR